MATYQVIRKLGEGGHGIVYEAEQVELKRRVALKRLRPELRCRPRMVERFAREAHVCGSLTHPNVATVHDSGVDESGPFIAFELLRGETLLELARREAPLPPSVVLDIVDGALRGLGSAHACGIVHRDIKPANVFLCVQADGTTTVKLLDFGIAKRHTRESLTGLTNPGDVVGSFSFMAHEQLFQREVDGRTDLYSLGVCMYMLLSGVKPFDALTVQDLLVQLNERPKPLAERVPSISPALSATVQRALERDPNDRFASAEEMRVALLACGEGKGRAASRHSTISDITIREVASPASRLEAPFSASTTEPPEDGVTEPRIIRPSEGKRLAAPSEAETMPRAISSRSIAREASEAVAKDPFSGLVPLLPLQALEPLEHTARMVAPIPPGHSVPAPRMPASQHDPAEESPRALRNVAVAHSGALPRVTPQPPAGRDVSPSRTAPSVDVDARALNRVVLPSITSATNDRGAVTARALRLRQLRGDDAALERALGNHRRTGPVRTVIFGVFGVVAALVLATAAYVCMR